MAENKVLKCALFDLDGVVFDTEPQYTTFWGNIFKEFYPEQPGLEHVVKGQTLVQIYDKYFHGMIERQADITHRLDLFEAEMSFNYVKGFERFVADLRRNGVSTAVVTSSNREKMSAVYKAHPEMNTMFDKILTSEDFERSKPDPDCYIKGAQHFGCVRSECVVFEDSFNGLKSGKAADMFVFGLSTTNTPEAIKPFSDYVIDDYTDMSYAKVCDILAHS